MSRLNPPFGVFRANSSAAWSSSCVGNRASERWRFVSAVIVESLEHAVSARSAPNAKSELRARVGPRVGLIRIIRAPGVGRELVARGNPRGRTGAGQSTDARPALVVLGKT